ncbi:MAG TPA: TIGR02391 family protein [Aggregatilineaceae bacterium]|nr:TIGR02391 family protein [Aggregatilineaceae bacterium]
MTVQSIKDIASQLKTLNTELQQLPGVTAPAKGEASAKFTLELAVTNSDLLKVVSGLFSNGHHARAVEEAYKYLNNLVKRKVGETADGSPLMQSVFSAKNPKLKLNSLSNQSENDEQTGLMNIFAGAMMGIRNPRAHEHDWEDTELHALQLLTLANYLVERVEQATKP